MSQSGKDDITATVSQNKFAWNCDDLKNNNVANGIIRATDLTAGSWNGTFNFAITLKETTMAMN